MEEVIHVFVDDRDEIRASHTFAFAKILFLTLHYQITPLTRRR